MCIVHFPISCYSLVLVSWRGLALNQTVRSNVCMLSISLPNRKDLLTSLRFYYDNRLLLSLFIAVIVRVVGHY